ncbi:hypothetical protein [Streptomyces sp. DW26H14]|uniref:hypothetical protein n=1 Tax=Streptomyces sp. DW26H14 TaxID=3435395 RepID=UPI00403D6840
MTTTTSYGTWCNRVDQYSTSVEHSVAEAFGSFGADDYDFDGIVRAYRDAINAALPDSVTLAGDEFIGPAYDADCDWTGYPTTEVPDGLEDEYEGGLDIAAIIEGVDLNTIMERHELWDASRVAQELGYTSRSAAGTARKRLSQWGVKAHTHRPSEASSRVQAYYLSGDVMDARATHPERAKAGA